jgi:ABC-type cobalamin/Fe3+-siderophores transport system ATPase subunit
MLIKRFYIPSNEAASIGLQEINMPRLGRYVAIAGKNGAGKTRLLTMLEQSIQNCFTNTDLVHRFQNQIAENERTILNTPEHPDVPKWGDAMAQAQLQLEHIFGRVFKDDDQTNFRAVKFVPKGLNFDDPRRHAPQSLVTQALQANNGTIENFQAYCLPYIQMLQNRWWSVTHQNYLGDASEKETTIQEYKKLNELVGTLLGVNLERTKDDEASIFCKPLAEAGLSDGQKVILQLAVALHAQKGILNNIIFILDELENHLHPSATIDLLKKLDEVAPNAQIWIATHSVSLLAYIASKEPMSIWYMEDGKVTHSGRSPERVLAGLLGDENGVGQVHAFTGLPALLAATTYAVESLFPPKTVAGGKRDDQVSQITNILQTKSLSGALSVLDFGAGKGRLLDGIASELKADEVKNIINYMAFDSSHEDKDVCCAVIDEYFGSSDGRYFGSSDEFFSQKDSGCIDVVVMCNVLHEIPPSQWVPLFDKNSLIMQALKKDGFLLLVEDQRIPVGEKAHEHGFLVLDTPQLKTLFGITEKDIKSGLFVHDDHRKDGRLKAHLVSKSLLGGN